MAKIALSRAECGHFNCAGHSEWLVTNGLGGYACGTISGAITRRYHGLLVAALAPPLGRTVLVTKMDAVAHYDGDGKVYPLSTNEYSSGAIDPRGYRNLETFYLDGLTPVWVYALADARLEQRIWMAHGHNTTYITYTLTRATDTVWLKLTPFCTYRDYHSLRRGGWNLNVETVNGGLEIKASASAQPFRVIADSGRFSQSGDWYWNFKYRAEKQRGLDDTEDLFVPGHFNITLRPHQTLTMICSTETVEAHAGATPLQQEQQRQAALLPPGAEHEPDWINHLALAADQFIVARPVESSPAQTPPMGNSIIAGYPWFTDWGRDTMAALPGLTLVTGRPQIAANILRSYAHFISQGMLPMRFSDEGFAPEYHTADTTLWYFNAIYQYLLYSGDMELVQTLYPGLVEIMAWHQRGTRHNIQVDSADGLLYAGEPGLQLTWMDAKIGHWVVTPRIGKPVDVNALWHNALCIMAYFSQRLNLAEAAQQYQAQAQLVAHSFRRRYWFETGEYLYDVIDGPVGELGPDGKRFDDSLRPNQILAVALPFKLLTDKQAKAVVDICAVHLLTSYGLRTLAAEDLAYTPKCKGDTLQRDSAYHQGTVWSWLLGPFVTAHYKVYGQPEVARSFLKPLEQHLREGCLGSIAEIFDGDPPHTARGCFARAWSVAELLRAWHETK